MGKCAHHCLTSGLLICSVVTSAVPPCLIPEQEKRAREDEPDEERRLDDEALAQGPAQQIRTPCARGQLELPAAAVQYQHPSRAGDVAEHPPFDRPPSRAVAVPPQQHNRAKRSQHAFVEAFRTGYLTDAVGVFLSVSVPDQVPHVGGVARVPPEHRVVGQPADEGADARYAAPTAQLGIRRARVVDVQDFFGLGRGEVLIRHRVSSIGVVRGSVGDAVGIESTSVRSGPGAAGGLIPRTFLTTGDSCSTTSFTRSRTDVIGVSHKKAATKSPPTPQRIDRWIHGARVGSSNRWLAAARHATMPIVHNRAGNCGASISPQVTGVVDRSSWCSSAVITTVAPSTAIAAPVVPHELSATTPPRIRTTYTTWRHTSAHTWPAASTTEAV